MIVQLLQLVCNTNVAFLPSCHPASACLRFWHVPMKNIVVSLISFMLILSSSPAEEPVAPTIPLRDFFRNPETTAYQLSPSGALIGFLKPVDNRLNIWIQAKSGGEAKQITSVKDRDIRGFFWKGDQYLLYLKDNGGDENYHLFVARSDGNSSSL